MCDSYLNNDDLKQFAEDLASFKNQSLDDAIDSLSKSLPVEYEFSKRLVLSSYRFACGFPAEDNLHGDELKLYLKCWLTRVKKKIARAYE